LRHTYFSNLALALLKINETAHAVTAAKRCTELAPTFAKGWFRLGAAHRAKGNLTAACAAFESGLPHASKDEADELNKGLAEATKALDALPGGIEEVSPSAAGGKAATWAVPAGASAAKASGKVDLAKAVETARRVAERAAPSAISAADVAKLGFSGFERAFIALWARGKCGAEREPELAAYLGLLSTDERTLVNFVGDALSEDTLSGMVLATERALLPADAAGAAALLCRLAAVRRFDMLWMFQTKKESAAAEKVLRAAVVGSDAATVAAIQAAAAKYGVKLA